MKAERGIVRLTVATNHPVSAFLIFASQSVFANTLLSWVRGGLGNTVGLRKVRRCLIAGVSLMVDILMSGQLGVLGEYIRYILACQSVIKTQFPVSVVGKSPRGASK